MIDILLQISLLLIHIYDFSYLRNKTKAKKTQTHSNKYLQMFTFAFLVISSRQIIRNVINPGIPSEFPGVNASLEFLF